MVVVGEFEVYLLVNDVPLRELLDPATGKVYIIGENGMDSFIFLIAFLI